MSLKTYHPPSDIYFSTNANLKALSGKDMPSLCLLEIFSKDSGSDYL